MDKNKEYEIAQSLKIKNDKEKQESFRKSSKERLYKIAVKKIKTTMIGAIASIENNFGYLWNTDDLSTEQLEMKAIFEKARQEILDNGNNQIRNLQTEMQQYDIEWKRFTMSLPIKTK